MRLSKKAIRQWMVPILIYPFLGIMIFWFRVLPIQWLRCFAAYVARWVIRLADRPRREAFANLNRVYGNEISREECEVMVHQVFTEIIKSFIEYIAFSKLTDKKRFFS